MGGTVARIRGFLLLVGACLGPFAVLGPGKNGEVGTSYCIADQNGKKPPVAFIRPPHILHVFQTLQVGQGGAERHDRGWAEEVVAGGEADGEDNDADEQPNGGDGGGEGGEQVVDPAVAGHAV